MERASDAPAGVAFGRFRVLPHRREVLVDGQPIKLGGRAFDVLMALIEMPGAIVGKDALMARVWPDRVVAEHNLQAQISALRAGFGADRDLIRTVAGRGYQFTGEIHETSGSPDERAAAGIAAAPPTNLPAPVSELIGRDVKVAEVVSLIGAQRLVTLTGAGGIGKTRLALAAARRLLPHFADGVWLAEFSALADPALVPATVAAAVGLELGGGEASAQRVAQALADRRLMLVFDTCEHVIDAAAGLAQAVLRANPAAQVIATSRERLRAEGEWAYPVPPLDVPPEDAEPGDDPSRYGAVLLLVQRARAAQPHFVPDRRGAAMIGAICRRLEGLPLAIELAAARVTTLGIEEVAARLDDRFRLLTGGGRTALPRHQTLRATLDWSYELLPEPERTVIRRLAVFAGAFSLEAAVAVVASRELVSSEAVEGLTTLVTKSLVAAEGDGTVVRYHLLDTTRAYALEKLGESGERERLAQRHAEYYRDLFERAEAEWEPRSSVEWLAEYGHTIDNLRSALDWAFSPAGDASIGVALTAAAVPLWTHLSLLEECRGRVERALATFGAEATRDERIEMKLYAALGASLSNTRGPIHNYGTAWAKALNIAERLQDADYQLRSLRGLWSFNTASGQHRAALEMVERFYALVTKRPDHPNDRLVGERMMGVSLFYLGDLSVAQRHLASVLADYVTPGNRSHVNRFQIDPRVSARVFDAWIHWLQGFPDQAMRVIETSIEDAGAINHTVTLCYALAFGACPIALWVGNLVAAEKYVGMLLNYSTRHALARWRALGSRHQAMLVIKRGDVAGGLRLLRASFDELGEANTAFRLLLFLSEMAEAQGRAGQIADGLVTIEEAIALTQQTEERWLTAELLRIKGELLLLEGEAGAAATAEDHFRQSLDWACRQGALSLELRAATNLAGLLRDQGRCADALARLQPVYARFTEGFDTADLQTAKRLLDALQ
jgi:predicted ATPase